jgi:hypothetical protein
MQSDLDRFEYLCVGGLCEHPGHQDRGDAERFDAANPENVYHPDEPDAGWAR